MIKKLSALLLLPFILSSYAQEITAEEINLEEFTTNNIHFHMGVVAAFAEVVKMDVKQIGLSEMFTAEEADKWEAVIKHITDRNGVLYYREDDFLVTDLFPASLTDGLTLFVIYKGDTLEKYKALKARKTQLIVQNSYDQAARREIAKAFGGLLDYSDEVIDELIVANGLQN